MRNLSRGLIVGTGITVLTVIGLLFGTTVNSQPPESKGGVPTPAVSIGQTYVGVKKCSACHFKQYTAWKKTGHAKEAWESVPAKYRTSAECLLCHATGYGQPTGFKDAASTPNLTGTTCEACHGPGSKHEEVCKPYLNKKKLDPAEDKIARDSIYKAEISGVKLHELPHYGLQDKAAQDVIAKIKPGEVCAACHSFKTPADHPKYDKQ
jgi:hypothetical protein